MSPKPIIENTLFFGDNLHILREYVPTESIDLIYLDPPFNSNRSYNVLFKDESGLESEAQIAVFEDTWHWNRATEEAYHKLATRASDRMSKMIVSLREFIGENQMMAYLVMMAVRLIELHRVMKPTGSLYLHCDPTASHYLKVVLDTIFGTEHFLSEIIWKRTSAHSSAKRPGPVHDVILFYSKNATYTWNQQHQPYDESYVEGFYRYRDPDGRRFQVDNLTGSGTRKGETGKPWRGVDPTARGRHWMVPPSELDKLDAEGRIYWPPKGVMPRLKRYLDEMSGVPLQDIWTDIAPISSQAAERLGYPTQKPLALLERIIRASSNPGDWILDPFCGCGTTVVAAQNLGRRWIGIDVSHLAMTLQKYRLQDTFPDAEFKVIGEPQSLSSAYHLAEQNRFQFEWWALSLVRARPSGGQQGSKQGKKGADRGVDGVVTFIDESHNKPKRVLVQVKSGKVGSRDIRDLRGAVEREAAAIGVLITLEKPTAAMEKEAVSAGFYHSVGWGRDYPRIQILTIEELMQGKGVDMPPEWGTFKQAERARKQEGTQAELGL